MPPRSPDSGSVIASSSSPSSSETTRIGRRSAVGRKPEAAGERDGAAVVGADPVEQVALAVLGRVRAPAWTSSVATTGAAGLGVHPEAEELGGLGLVAGRRCRRWRCRPAGRRARRRRRVERCIRARQNSSSSASSSSWVATNASGDSCSAARRTERYCSQSSTPRGRTVMSLMGSTLPRQALGPHRVPVNVRCIAGLRPAGEQKRCVFSITRRSGPTAWPWTAPVRTNPHRA